MSAWIETSPECILMAKYIYKWLGVGASNPSWDKLL